MRYAGFFISLVVLLLLSTGAAQAAEKTHRLREGESLSTVARHYYGAAWKAVYVLGRNGLLNQPEIKPGTKLTIPACWTYKVRRGDSLAKLAKKYLGNSDRYVGLMKENGMRRPEELAPGAELLMPFHIRYEVNKGDSLSKIARKFYRSTRRAELIREYNQTSNAIEPGQKLVIPIFDRAALELGEKGTPPAPSSGGAGTAKAPASETAKPLRTSTAAKAALNKAIAGYRSGEFKKSCDTMEEQLADLELAPKDQAELIKYLAFCGIAFDDPGAARDYFRKWLELVPGAKLDPIETSPRILAVFQAVVAEVSGSGP